jgi:hypothetical protein
VLNRKARRQLMEKNKSEIDDTLSFNRAMEHELFSSEDRNNKKDAGYSFSKHSSLSPSLNFSHLGMPLLFL